MSLIKQFENKVRETDTLEFEEVTLKNEQKVWKNEKVFRVVFDKRKVGENINIYDITELPTKIQTVGENLTIEESISKLKDY